MERAVFYYVKWETIVITVIRYAYTAYNARHLLAVRCHLFFKHLLLSLIMQMNCRISQYY